uniref:Uncharacterized protein n=1 Tax=Hyaloperonospora arabidopsidis (strain Emoy2) TaxID=559515 RepID=M4B9K3_HYAAE
MDLLGNVNLPSSDWEKDREEYALPSWRMGGNSVLFATSRWKLVAGIYPNIRRGLRASIVSTIICWRF